MFSRHTVPDYDLSVSFQRAAEDFRVPLISRANVNAKMFSRRVARVLKWSPSDRRKEANKCSSTPRIDIFNRA